MQNITTPSISALESIAPDLLARVSGGCDKKKGCLRRPPPQQPPRQPPPQPVAEVMGPPQQQPQEQQMADGGDSVVNTITINYGGSTGRTQTTRTA